jgi:hypothetical protein
MISHTEDSKSGKHSFNGTTVAPKPYITVFPLLLLNQAPVQRWNVLQLYPENKQVCRQTNLIFRHPAVSPIQPVWLLPLASGHLVTRMVVSPGSRKYKPGDMSRSVMTTVAVSIASRSCMSSKWSTYNYITWLKLRCSLPVQCSLQHATGPNPKPTESSPHSGTLLQRYLLSCSIN